MLTQKEKKILLDAARYCFFDMADKDYLAARLCFKHDLIFQYLWMSQQCCEKYLKCILLLNQKPTQSLNHKLDKIYVAVEEIDNNRIKFSESTESFLGYINQQGPNRYFNKTMFTLDYPLLSLDSSVHEIRTVCISEFDNHETNIDKEKASGYLEEILSSKINDQSKILSWKNLYFGRNRKKFIKALPNIHIEKPPTVVHPENLDFLSNFITQLTSKKSKNK